MQRFSLAACVLALLHFCALHCLASAVIEDDLDRLYERSDAVLQGTVVGAFCFREENGEICTQTSLKVDESFKGKFPSIVAICSRGGNLGNEYYFFGNSPQLHPGRKYILFLKRTLLGRLEPTDGSSSCFLLPVHCPLKCDITVGKYASPDKVRQISEARPEIGVDVTDQVGVESTMPSISSGMIDGVNKRFLQPDRAEPIPILVDAENLPSGISLAQATNALIAALDAWANVTSLKFVIEGIGAFGQSANSIRLNDEKIRIQLHDKYNEISSPVVLGIGGQSGISNPSPSGWNIGGNVQGREFLKSTSGFVIIKSTHPTVQDVNMLAATLCHEIGHALNLAHSSEYETDDPVLRDSIMYYRAHRDGRGPRLGEYDVAAIRSCYPLNTVPYTFDRVMDATMARSPLNISGINEIEIRGYDIQGQPLQVITADQSVLNGQFITEGFKVRYSVPVLVRETALRDDPAIASDGRYIYKDIIYFRVSDGENASPSSKIRVVSLRNDAGVVPDGIPDYWMNTYFGSSIPSVATLSRAADDADHDGLSNLDEYRLGTNPKDSQSLLRVSELFNGQITFPAQAYELYEIQSSSNLIDWELVRPIVPTSTATSRLRLPQTNIIVTVTNLSMISDKAFYRVQKIR